MKFKLNNHFKMVNQTPTYEFNKEVASLLLLQQKEREEMAYDHLEEAFEYFASVYDKSNLFEYERKRKYHYASIALRIIGNFREYDKAEQECGFFSKMSILHNIQKDAETLGRYLMETYDYKVVDIRELTVAAKLLEYAALETLTVLKVRLEFQQPLEYYATDLDYNHDYSEVMVNVFNGKANCFDYHILTKEGLTEELNRENYKEKAEDIRFVTREEIKCLPKLKRTKVMTIEGNKYCYDFGNNK